jgi:hypothetical protein
VTDPLHDLGLELARGVSAALDVPPLDFHTGQIIEWDSNNNTNRVLVLGVIMENLPILTSANTSGLVVGAAVGVLRVRTQFFVVGRVVSQDSGLVNPQFTVPLYPQFIRAGAANDVIYSYVLSSTNDPYWEGRLKASFPYLVVDGIWGPTGVGSTATFELQIGGTTVGSWTESTLVNDRRGPYDIRNWASFDWVVVKVVMTSNTGPLTNVAFQVLACYFRDTL